MPTEKTDTPISLPPPKTRGAHSLEDVLQRRRSIRELATPPLTWEEIGQMLWAAQGVTSAEGFRTTPSAGALYPMEVYVATAEGVFHYEPAAHAVTRTLDADVRAGLRQLSFDQACMDAPCVVVMAAVVARITQSTPRWPTSARSSRWATRCRTCCCRRPRWASRRCPSAPSIRRSSASCCTCRPSRR